MSHSAGVYHPYVPSNAAIPIYMPNTDLVPTLLFEFGLLIALFVAPLLFAFKRINPTLSVRELMVVFWFLLCFFLHAFFEGYFVLHHDSLAGRQDLFAQLWKEYALSDSRYMTSDAFMLCIETITVSLWAPLCAVVVVCVVSRSRFRYPLQLIMCVGHLFGVALYYGTCSFDYRYKDVSHSRPEFLYYWVYYVGFNFPWVVVPAVLLCESIYHLSAVKPTGEQYATRKEFEGLQKMVEETKQLAIERIGLVTRRKEAAQLPIKEATIPQDELVPSKNEATETKHGNAEKVPTSEQKRGSRLREDSLSQRRQKVSLELLGIEVTVAQLRSGMNTGCSNTAERQQRMETLRKVAEWSTEVSAEWEALEVEKVNKGCIGDDEGTLCSACSTESLRPGNVVGRLDCNYAYDS